MEDIEWRYQLVMVEEHGRQRFNIYEVGADKKSQDIVYIADPEPVVLSGESIDELMHILHSVHSDIRTYGLLSKQKVEDSVNNTEVEVEVDFEAEEQEYDLSDREYNEDDLVDMMDQAYDSEGKVVDIATFMERNK